MNQLTQHQGKNTFKSLVGIEIQEVFPLKDDDPYIDEIITKQLNLNNFYEPEDEHYWDEYQAFKSTGAIEEKLLRNYSPIEMVCGFHQFFFLKHKELIGALSNAKNFEKTRVEGKYRIYLVQYKKFVLRFWKENHIKFYGDLPILNALIPVIFDCDLPRMNNEQLLAASELLEILKIFSPSPKLNSCLNNFPRNKVKRDSILGAYKETCHRVLEHMVEKNLEKIPEIVSDATVQRRTSWMSMVKILIDLSSESNTEIVANTDSYFRFCENCLTQVFLNGNFHRDSVEANDILFYAISLFSTGLFFERPDLRRIYEQSRAVLLDLFLGRHNKWSRSVFEAFCVLLHVHDSNFMVLCYLKLPRYRVLKEYQEKGITQVLGHEAGGPFVQDDAMDAVDKLESLKHVANPDVQAMIENYSLTSQTVY